MSRHHYAHAQEASTLLYDIDHSNPEELMHLYGIEIYEDGTVFDPVENRKFNTVYEWAEWQSKEEEWDEIAHPHASSRKFDEEF